MWLRPKAQVTFAMAVGGEGSGWQRYSLAKGTSMSDCWSYDLFGKSTLTDLVKVQVESVQRGTQELKVYVKRSISASNFSNFFYNFIILRPNKIIVLSLITHKKWVLFLLVSRLCNHTCQFVSQSISVSPPYNSKTMKPRSPKFGMRTKGTPRECLGEFKHHFWR